MFKKRFPFSAVGIISCFTLSLLSTVVSCDAGEQKNAVKTESPKVQNKEKTYHGDIHVPKLSSEKKFEPDSETNDSKEGHRLYETFKCAQCHQISHKGGYAGPSLDGVGANGRDYVYAHINNPQAEAVKKDRFFELVPTSMPKYAITPAQAKKITDYLMTLPAPQ